MANWLTWQSKQVVLNVNMRSVHGRASSWRSGKCRTPLAAVSYQVFFANVVGHRQDLQAALGHLREEVIGVLAAHHVGDRVARLLDGAILGSAVLYLRPAAGPSLASGPISARNDCLPMTTSAVCGLSSFLGERRRIRLHGQPMP